MKKDPRTHAIIGAVMEIHRIIGPGHLEAVYHECLEIEFRKREIPFISQPKLEFYYKETKLKKYYIPDFIVYNEVENELLSELEFNINDKIPSMQFKLIPDTN